MPDKNTKKLTNEKLAVLENNSKGFFGKLNQERAYEILSQGAILTMEDDLKEALSRQTMKADLIPDHKRKEKRAQEFFSEKPVFNPFGRLGENEKKVSKEVKPKDFFNQSVPVKKAQEAEVKVFQKGESNNTTKPKQKFEETIIQPSQIQAPVKSKEIEIKEEMEKAHKEAQENEDLKKGIVNNTQNIQRKEVKEVIRDNIKDTQPKEAQEPEILKEIIGNNTEKIRQNLNQKAISISSELKEINPKEELFNQKRKVILDKIALQKKALESFSQKVESVRVQKIELEKQERVAQDGIVQHSLEEQRWGVEEKFKKAQDLLWSQEEEIEKAQLALSKIDKDLKDQLENKAKLEKEKLEIQKFLDNLGFLEKRESFLNRNESLLSQKSQLEENYNKALLQKNKQEQDITNVVVEEQKIENELRALEDKIQKAVDNSERRKLEQERRELTQKRQGLEKRRWEIEKSQQATKDSFNITSEKFFNLKKEEENFNQKLAEIEARINKDIPLPEVKEYLRPEFHEGVEKEKPQEKPVLEKQEVALKPILAEPIKKEDSLNDEELKKEQQAIEQIRLNAKEKEQEVVQKQFVQKQVLQEQKATQDEFKEIQERENREKAIAKLKQIAEQEQKRASLKDLKGPLTKGEILKKLTKVSLQEENQRKDFLARVNKKIKILPRKKQKSLNDAVIFHPMIRKISLFEKIAVRFLIILTVIGFGVGVYFGLVYLNERKKNVPPIVNTNATTSPNLTSEWPSIFPNSSTTLEATSTLPSEAIPDEPAVTNQNPPQALIPIATNNVITYQGDSQQLAALIVILLQNSIQYNSFEQISIFDESQQKYLQAGQFFGVLGADLPVEFNQENTTTTILIFASKFGNRIGFITQTENGSALKEAFLSWESQAEQDTASIFELMGKATPALKKTFSNLKYKTNTIKCQTFAKSDLGICYLVYKNYLVWASSFEQISRIVDKLP